MEWTPSRPLSIAGTIGSLRRGSADPTYLADADSVWRTLHTPLGPATQHICRDGSAVIGRHWGPGASWAAERLPRLLGEDDDASTMNAEALAGAHHPDLGTAWLRMSREGWRVPSSGEVFTTLIAAVLEQRVTGVEARRAWRWLTLHHADPAPPAPGMPVGMRCPLSADQVRRIPSWDWHRAGVDPQRSRTLVQVAPYAHRIEECRDLALDKAVQRLTAFPGIGDWTAAEVRQRALGDADAVSFGDFHIPANTVYALTGRIDGDDHLLAEVLAPWTGHRFRITRAVEIAGISRPRRGPRMTIQDHRRH
jgi:3-methyladenine DNA glycosylase/8-oxoguanine DNA glycosylase